MTVEEVGELIALIVAFDCRTVGDEDVVAWLAAVGDLEYTDARDAVVAHYRETADRITPAHVRRRVAAARRALDDRQHLEEILDSEQYRRRILSADAKLTALIRRIAGRLAIDAPRQARPYVARPRRQTAEAPRQTAARQAAESAAIRRLREQEPPSDQHASPEEP